MANGDAAAAAGLPVVAATDKVRLGYDQHNTTRDQLVQRVFPNSQLATVGIAKGGTGATTAAAARAALIVPGDATGAGMTFDSPSFGRISFAIPGLAFPTTLANLNDVPDISGKRDLTDGNFGSTPIYTPNGRATPVVTGYVSAYLDSAGRLGATPSSRRFKKDIEAWTPDLQAVLALQLVTFRYKASLTAGNPVALEVGLIAEELVTLGLDWLVFYDSDDKPQGINYERLALALLPVIQNHESRLAALEATE